MATRFVFWGGGEEGLGIPPPAPKVTLIAGGFYYSLVRKDNGEVWSWGLGGNGQLGINSRINKSSPVSVIGNHSFVAIAAGASPLYPGHSLALKAFNGQAWSWGLNESGQLGDSTINDKSSPISVIGNHSFIAISVHQHCLALKANGEVWAWGRGIEHQLGTGLDVDRSTPTAVVGNHSFISVSAGNQHSLALKANGEVWSWGFNQYGAIGNGTNGTVYDSPVLVVGGHSFLAITAGGDFSLGLKSSGEVWSWGYNAVAQLGYNDLIDRSSPVSVIGNHSFVAIAAGLQHCLALKANGEVWAWGGGGGVLGDNTNITKSSPVSVIGNHSFVAIASGWVHSLACKANGEVWSWGENYRGALGDGTTTYRSSPVLVIGLL